MNKPSQNSIEDLIQQPQWRKHFETVNIIPFEQRHKLIGGTALSAVLGVNPYLSPLQVWNIIVNDIEPTRTEYAEKKMKAGKKLEKVIFEFFVEEFKPDHIIYISEFEISFQSKIYDFIAGTPDAICIKDGVSYIVEIKNLGHSTAKEFKDSVPYHYLCQASLYTYLFNTDKYVFAILVDGYDFQIVGPFDADHQFVNTLIETANNFWNKHVLTKQPPPPVSYQEVVSLYPIAQQKTVKGNKEIYELYQQALQKLYTIDLLTKELEEIKFKIAEYMKEADTLIYGNKPLVSFKTIQTNKLDSQKLKKEMPEIYQQFQKEVSYRRMEFIKKEEDL